jgi:hypothetical protein
VLTAWATINGLGTQEGMPHELVAAANIVQRWLASERDAFEEMVE